MRVRALWPIGALAIAALLSPSAASGAAAPGGGLSNSAGQHERGAGLHFFHVRLSSSRRADCVEQAVSSPHHPELRCDRFRYGPSPAQEISVHIVHGTASRLDPSDAVPDPAGTRLRAGHTLRIGPYTCGATRHSVRCRDRHTGHGFRMKSHHLFLF